MNAPPPGAEARGLSGKAGGVGLLASAAVVRGVSAGEASFEELKEKREEAEQEDSEGRHELSL